LPIVRPLAPVMPSVPLSNRKVPLFTRLPVLSVPPLRTSAPVGLIVMLPVTMCVLPPPSARLNAPVLPPSVSLPVIISVRLGPSVNDEPKDADVLVAAAAESHVTSEVMFSLPLVQLKRFGTPPKFNAAALIVPPVRFNEVPGVL